MTPRTWSLLLIIASAISTTAQNKLVSGWSPASNKISLRIVCPETLVIGGNKLGWIICEVKNEGDSAVLITNQARLFVMDDQGTTRRCLRRELKLKSLGNPKWDVGRPKFEYVRSLPAKGTNSWWESGELVESGSYRVYAVLDHPRVQTPAVRVNLAKFATDDTLEETRIKALQRDFASFPVVLPNAEKSAGTYHWVAFTNDPVVIDGELFHAFRFKTSDQPRKLDWSFIRNATDQQTWFIVPRKGRMEGFTHFGGRNVPGLARPGDTTVIQDLPAENFVPGAEYCIWFQPLHGLLKGMLVSLNFTAGDPITYRSTPEAIKERNLCEPVQQAPQ